MRVIKDGKPYPITIPAEVIVTEGTNLGKNLDDVLDEHQKEIDRLKSNMKYLYSYGGVGGTGNGGGSGSSVTKSASFIARLGGHKLENGGNSIILNNPGSYQFIVNVRDSNGQTFYVKYSIGGGDMSKPLPLSTSLNMCEYSTTLNLQKNSEIVIEFLDSDGVFLDSIRQGYIVNPHTFEVKFKYMYNDGKNENVFDSNNEYFIGDTQHTDPFIDISYRIDIVGVSNVQVTYDINGTDRTSDEHTGHGVKSFGDLTDITNDHFKIYLGNLLKDGEEFVREENTGNYDVSVKLSYSASGENVTTSPITFTFTMIPNHMYINVRNPQDLFYNTFDDIIKAKDEGISSSGEGGIPSKNITAGSYASFYCKVYEGEIKTNKEPYTIKCSVYDYVNENSDSEIDYDEDYFSSEPSYVNSLTVTEQVESSTPFSVSFSTFGIKKIVFEADHSKNDGVLVPTIKYIYVRKPSETITWTPEGLEMYDYYFRSNNGDDTYSREFPELPSGYKPLELKKSDKNALTIQDSSWESPLNNFDTTIVSFGMQYNQINSENSEILKTYATDRTNTPDITLYPNKIFSTDGEISIPYENGYDISDPSKYHLVQIVRTELEKGTKKYGTYLYIDGIPEAVKTSTDDNNLYVGKIVLNNINIIYNLIEVQYISKGDVVDVLSNEQEMHKFKYYVDELIYRYYLKYKERMLGQEISSSERTILNCIDNNHSIKFDGTNVIMDISTVESIAPNMPIPSMVLDYSSSSDDDAENLEQALFKGYGNGENGAFGTKAIKLMWSEGMKENTNTDLHEILIPKFGDVTGSWFVELQGTSTMRNRIKNFSVGISTESNEENEKILFSPNYDPDDYSTFLPEAIWTLKADVADSAHANNTSIGRFVNKVCTKFQTGQNYSLKSAPYIKNTLEGFPVMMYFKINNKVFYLGVYNFNMGRNSYYNLGYHTPEDTDNMIESIPTDQTDVFIFSKGRGFVNSSLCIGEIQENLPQFDFHQYDTSVLFQSDDSSIVKMFGKDSKITYGTNVSNAKTTLAKFVKSVAFAGAYCFGNIEKEDVSSKGDGDYNECVDRYSEKNHVPTISKQMKYDTYGNITWYDATDSFDDAKGDVDKLLSCIGNSLYDDTANTPVLDYTSASEYYTICMAFGLIDSVLKNMNIKSWDGNKCYICFYDMDCALGEDNSGAETVSYLAATDYWHSDKSGGDLLPVTIDWDYWDDTVGKGFDCKSSYLFAIVKYAQPLLKKIGRILTHYPQEFWAILRQPDGELRSADYFVNNYFKSGIGSIPSYMAALDYKVKYLYKGKILTDNDSEGVETYLANAVSFHGSRVFKVKEWLSKRLHFLDAMFNVQGVSIPISQNVYVPIPDDSVLMDKLRSNLDVTVLQDAFSTNTNNTSLMSSKQIRVEAYAPMNTPIVMVVGPSYQIYLLNEGAGKPNYIIVNVPQPSITIKCLGSKEITDLSIVEPFLTNAYQVVSDKIENIVYGGHQFTAQGEFTITSSSVKNISMCIPGFKGRLNITSSGSYGQALSSLNVSKSGFYGSWEGLSDLQELDISLVNAPTETISVSNSKLLTGECCNISGTDIENLTILNTLNISDISGNFILKNTAIEKINMSALDEVGKESKFTISGDNSLRELTLTGFNEIEIVNCKNLRTLSINDNSKKCRSIIIKCDTDNDVVLDSFNSNREGVFDFMQYSNLEWIGLSGNPNVEVIKIPNKSVNVKSFQNNKNLEFVDTYGKNSCIVLTDESTFYRCPCYGMMQSWEKKTTMAISPSCTSLAHTFNKVVDSKSKYLGENKYENDFGKFVNNSEISQGYAKWFINTVVAGGYLDDSYIDEYGEEHDDNGYDGHQYGSDCSKNITSLQGCFKMQKSIRYNGDQDIPNLSAFKNLTDISGMYQNTSVTYIDTKILSLPNELNRNVDDDGNEIPNVEWREFIGSGQINISLDGLSNISYRIEDLSSMTFTVKNPDDSSEELVDVDIIDVLCPREYDVTKGVLGEDYVEINGKNYEINKKLRSFTSFGINYNQNVDYTKMFKLCPNVTTLSSFLNGDLSNATIDGMLYPCKKLKYIVDSFNHNGNMSDSPSIDLYTFFNWEDNKDIESLFVTTGTNNSVGFSINKTITYEHFNTIIGLLKDYTKITKLSNLFSYCTINGYDNSDEISLTGDMKNITSIDSLFYQCKGVDGSGENVPLNIRRSFFSHLPNVMSMANAFGGVYFSNMLTYDFFCKYRRVTDSNVYVYVDGSYKKAKLKTFNYGSNLITNMFGCFKNAKFKECKSWFVADSNYMLKPDLDTVEYDGDNTYTKYYTLEGGVYKEHLVECPVAVSDTVNNFTNYVPSVHLPIAEFKLNNHDIFSDLDAFDNGDEIYEENSFGVYPTHCCLPPDIFHACYYSCDLTEVFANTNIIGVIPQHLVIKCYSGIFKNMLLNTNILPNIIYHYDKNTADDPNYLSMISNIEVDDNQLSSSKSDDDNIVYDVNMDVEPSVLFRDENGVLKRRHPISGEYKISVVDGVEIRENEKVYNEYSKSQFAYVPQGYTENPNLESAFTFRYNLPQQTNLIAADLSDEGITWDSTTGGIECSPDKQPGLWPYYVQYFFLADESVEWKNVSNMKYPFISDQNDIDFSNGLIRIFSTDNKEGVFNTWYDKRELIDKNAWSDVTNGTLNVFIDLCGEKNPRTGVYEDCGCKISESIKNYKFPKLDSFVSGILTIFLNGMVFDEFTDAGKLTSLNAGSKVVIFNGFGRNIILPDLKSLPNAQTDSKVVLGYNTELSQFYEFMFPTGSKDNYNKRYFANNINIYIAETCNTGNIVKYKVS